MNRKYYVYAYIRSEDSTNGKAGSPYYIGKGSGYRAYSKNRGIKPPADKSRILILASDLTEADAHEMETNLIAKHGRLDLGTGCLRNRTNGGEGVSGAHWTRDFSQSHRENMSRVRKGKPGHPQSQETREKIRQSLTGRTRPQEVKDKISMAKKGVPNPHPGNSWKKHSAETLEKLSASLKIAWIGRKARMTLV